MASISTENVKRANELLGEIEKTQILIRAYDGASEVVVGLRPSNPMTSAMAPDRLEHRIELPARDVQMAGLAGSGEELALCIVRMLEWRVAEMQSELQSLGVE